MFRFVLMSTLALQVLSVLPLFVGGFSESYGFNEGQLGILAAADLVGASLACIAIFIYVERVSWRKVILIATLVAFVSNVVCIWAEQYSLLVLMRLIAGVSAGVIYSLAMVAIGNGQNVTRDYGWAVAGQALVATLYYVTLPSLIETQGLHSLFIIMAVNMLVCALLLPKENLIGQSSTDSDESWGYNNPGNSLTTVSIGLLGIFLLYVAQGGIWVFVERIGHAAGHSPEAIGYVLAVAALLGIVAGMTAAIQGARLGFRLPLWFIFIGQSVAILQLWWAESYMGYLLAIALYNFCWTYVVPFHMSIIAQCDDSKKAVALAPAFQGGGLAAGAAIAGAVLEASTGYLELYKLATVLGVLSLWLMLTAVKRNNRELLLVLAEEAK